MKPLVNQSPFIGFSSETFDFLEQLRKNNNREWFEKNKLLYQNHLLKPLQELVAFLGPTMITIDPLIEIQPSINKTISRIYRDIRFSKDKSPYKTAMWVSFKRPAKIWQDSPAYFFEINAESYSYGMGFYMANKETMKEFREMIDNDIDEFKQIISFYPKQTNLKLEGELYKKLMPSNLPEEINTWYQRKNLFLMCTKPLDKNIYTSKFADQLAKEFTTIKPLYNFLWEAKNLTISL